jgi:hypothetical protein
LVTNRAARPEPLLRIDEVQQKLLPPSGRASA